MSCILSLGQFMLVIFRSTYDVQPSLSTSFSTTNCWFFNLGPVDKWPGNNPPLVWVPPSSWWLLGAHHRMGSPGSPRGAAHSPGEGGEGAMCSAGPATTTFGGTQCGSRSRQRSLAAGAQRIWPLQRRMQHFLVDEKAAETSSTLRSSRFDGSIINLDQQGRQTLKMMNANRVPRRFTGI